jgi:MFS family permease
MYTQKSDTSYHESVCVCLHHVLLARSLTGPDWLADIIGCVSPLKYPKQHLITLTRLGTIFYLSYLAFEFPQNLALQRFPVGKWMRHVTHSAAMNLSHLKRPISSFNIFIWAIALCSHAACKNFAGLFAVRFVLGMCEGSITAGFMIVSSMFYTRREQTARIGYWCKCYD